MSEQEYHDQTEMNNHNEQRSNVQPSAPSSDDNGFIVVPPTPQTSSVETSHTEKTPDILTKESQEEISKLLVDISNSTDKVVAEADSSTNNIKNRWTTVKKDSKQQSGCSLCPYYLLACDYISKMQVPPKVKDMLLWVNPKLTGAVFGSAFVLLVSISLFSLLTVVSSFMLLALILVGTYRFYLALIFRIKGVQDQTFDKLSEFDLSLPKDKVKEYASLLEADLNKMLNKMKLILLWDNVVTSSVALVGFYIIYCIGCWFNTITLMILALISAFTLPKVYQVYKKPIDQGIQKATDAAHLLVNQVIAKVPFLNKKKNQ